jgi:PAS domain S-box-containing protein
MPRARTVSADPAALPEGVPAGWQVALLTALAYALVGWFGLTLAGPPGYASPLYPSAGIALAAVLVYGRAALPGVALGAFAVNLTLGTLRAPEGAPELLLPATIGLGATLQAAAGAWLVRRFAAQPLTLSAPRDILYSGLLGAAVACLISASVATPALLAAGVIGSSQALVTWGTWWVGDTLGVMIGAPLALTLIGRPVSDWRPRQLTLGLPLLMATALLAAAMLQLQTLEEEREQAQFEREVDRLVAAVESRLVAPVHALQAVHSAALAVGGELRRDSLHEASRWWLAQPLQLQAMGYSTMVARPAVPAFVAGARLEGEQDYRVFDRDEIDVSADDSVLALRLIEPRQGNEGALGVNTLSIGAARAAVLAAARSGEPAATAGFRLTQSQTGETGMVLYRTLHRDGSSRADAGASDVEVLAGLAGVVFVTLGSERTLAGVGNAAPQLRWCLHDADPQAAPRVLGDGGACDAKAATETNLLQTVRALSFGGRPLQLSLSAPPRQLPGLQHRTGWLLAIASLFATALLGALLLTVTGQTRRTERAIVAATGKLRREIQERSEVQAALGESEARLRAIVDHAPLGVAFLDPLGHYLQINETLSRLLGLPAEALLGQRIIDRAHPDDRELVQREHRAILRGGSDFNSQQLRLARANGSWLWVRITASAQRDAGGRVRHFVAIVEDISERLRLEHSERALQQAEAANRAKSDFVSRMSHELRTPLNAMIGFAQLLGLDRKAPLVGHQRDWVQQIQRAGWHLLEMINDTLDLARIESGAVQIEPAPVLLSPLVATCEAMLASAAEQRGVYLQHQLAPTASAVLGDATRVKQILINLLSNAIKYNREGGYVTVRSRLAEDGLVELVVDDTGLGMTPEQQDSLFQPYNRLGRESSDIEGTGIGLVISQRLAELMGGTLSAASRPGQGSTFTLRLPAAEQAQIATVTEQPTLPPPYHQRHVHYVEDNTTNVEVMRGILAQRPQIHLSVSGMGLDGLAAIKAQRPDLILLDMQLPDISGLELLRHLKLEDAVASIPVIVVSADATPKRRREALSLGALHYVTKPVAFADFLALVDGVLDGIDTRFGL